MGLSNATLANTQMQAHLTEQNTNTLHNIETVRDELDRANKCIADLQANLSAKQ